MEEVPKILVAEISGKRPGTSKSRPTEKIKIDYDKVIISNNSEGYVTDWEIINVPEEYRKWYIDNIKNSENAWYAPMNRSYAIKYAKEHGYKYLIQLDDNIEHIELHYRYKKNGIYAKYRKTNSSTNDLMDDAIDMLVCVLKNTNAGMVGCQLSALASDEKLSLSERYCYSFFALDLQICPEVFQGDFEDDIEYRLKCCEMNVPVCQIPILQYSKTGQAGTKDKTGCREEYIKAGLKRGEHMCKIHGDIYSCKMQGRRHNTTFVPDGGAYFKHELKKFKLGIIVYDKQAIEDKLKEMLKKYAVTRTDKCSMKEKKVKLKDGKTSKRN